MRRTLTIVQQGRKQITRGGVWTIQSSVSVVAQIFAYLNIDAPPCSSLNPSDVGITALRDIQVTASPVDQPALASTLPLCAPRSSKANGPSSCLRSQLIIGIFQQVGSSLRSDGRNSGSGRANCHCSTVKFRYSRQAQLICCHPPWAESSGRLQILHHV